jgi:hypothetical protein
MYLKRFAVALTAICATFPIAGIAQNSTIFGPNVYVFDNTTPDPTIQTTLNSKSVSGQSQFGTGHTAILFMPGTYDLQAAVGFNESIAGLGADPSGVVINGYLTTNLTGANNASEDNTMWRSMENMTFNPVANVTEAAPDNTLQWGVSQGAAFRRIQVNGNLELDDTGQGGASGGFLGNTVVTGNINPGAQHNWFTRNTYMGGWGPVSGWVEVFMGITGYAPPADFPDQTVLSDWGDSNVELPQTPVMREKPYLYVDSNKNYNVFVPAVQHNTTGVTWTLGGGLDAAGYSLPISSFFIATPSSTLAQINAALAGGQSLILTPGIYSYSGSINVVNPNTIILGLGYANLIPQTGTPAITVPDVDGVVITGLLIDAGPVNSPVLLQVGNQSGPRTSHAANPTEISDTTIRIGGYKKGTATTSLELDSNDTILDNVWLWRADHGNSGTTGWTVNKAQTGLLVNGDNVTAIGMSVEHYQGYQTIWNGENGKTIFYQSEMPYDPPSAASWMNGAAVGYASYYVNPLVQNNQAYGVGVYCAFQQTTGLVADTAISVPVAAGVTVTGAVTDELSSCGRGSGGIAHVINEYGHAINVSVQNSFVPFFGGVAGTVSLTTAQSMTLQPDGSYLVTVTVTNSGTGAAQNVAITSVAVGSVRATTLPDALNGIAAGSSATATFSLPANAGAPNGHVVLTISGSYTGGTFGGSYRATLP